MTPPIRPDSPNHPDNLVHAREKEVYSAAWLLEMARAEVWKSASGKADGEWCDRLPGETIPPAPTEMRRVAPAEVLLLTLALQFAEAYEELADAVRACTAAEGA